MVLLSRILLMVYTQATLPNSFISEFKKEKNSKIAWICLTHASLKLYIFGEMVSDLGSLTEDYQKTLSLYQN